VKKKTKKAKDFLLSRYCCEECAKMRRRKYKCEICGHYYPRRYMCKYFGWERL